MSCIENQSYIRFHEIISNIRKEGEGLKARMEASAQFIVDAMDRVQGEIKPAQKEMDRAQGLLIAEEMNGQVNKKTAIAAEEAAGKVVKLEQSLKALSRTRPSHNPPRETSRGFKY